GDQQVVAVVVAHPAMAVRRVAQAVAVVVVDHVDRALVVVDVAATGPARAAVARGRIVVDHGPVVDHGGAVVDHVHRRAALVPGAPVVAVVAALVAGLAVVAAVLAVLAAVVIAMAVAAAAIGERGSGHRGQRHGKDGPPGEPQVHGSVSKVHASPTGGVPRLSAGEPESILPANGCKGVAITPV